MTKIVMMSIDIKNPRVGIISDLHLGIHSNSASWHKTAIEWATWIAGEFRQKKIKDIIFCGDWHHNRSEISVNTLQVSADILDIFQEFNVIAITGNHDVYYKYRTDVNSLSIFKNRRNVTIYDSVTTLNAFGKSICLCPWNTDINNIPNSDIVIGHFEIETFKMNSYKMCEEGIKITDLLQKSSCIISGHFHLRSEKKYSVGSILYVGNPFEMDLGDLGNEKGYYILDINKLNLEFFPNTISPRHVKISLKELALSETITEDIRLLIHNNIIRLKIDCNISKEDQKILSLKLNQLNPYSLQFDYDVQSKMLDASAERNLSSVDIQQSIIDFVKLLNTTKSESVLEYTLDLFNRCTL